VPAEACTIHYPMDGAINGRFQRTLSYQTDTVPRAEAAPTRDRRRLPSPRAGRRRAVLTEAWDSPKSRTMPLGMVGRRGRTG
jgi:hypothetical protein